MCHDASAKVVKGGVPTLASDAWALGCGVFTLPAVDWASTGLGWGPLRAPWGPMACYSHAWMIMADSELEEAACDDDKTNCALYTASKMREDTSRDVPAVSEGRKVRIEGAEGAEGAAATPLEEFRRLLGQLKQQYMAALSSNVQNAQGPQRPQGGKELEAENSTSSAIGIPPFDSQLATIRTSDEPAPSAGADVSYSGESEAESSQATMKSTPLTTVKETLSSRRSSESLKDDTECYPEDVTHDFREEDLPKAKSTWDRCRSFLQSDIYELVMGLLIIVNSISMFVEFEFQGYVVGHSLDYPRMHKPPEQVWPSAQHVFDTMNLAFTITFLVDIVLRIGFLRSQFFRLSFNWLDFLVVLCSVVEILFEELLPLDTVFIRLLRLGKVARAIRVVRQTEGMSSLIMLLKCVQASFNTLCWSLSFIVVLQCIAGMVISQVVSQYMTDDTISPEARRAVFRYYGTFTSTFLTMFEVLLANWAPAARILVDNVSDIWVYVFVVYRCVVGFAILNVVNAVFIQQTMRVAQADQELIIKQRIRAESAYASKMRLSAEETWEHRGPSLKGPCKEIADVIPAERMKVED
ncbi:unnamed protein product [Cladocopium goreaui]|uniref:Probable voltage-dependent R-type calcium channel subunit alpha-1E (DOE-1) (Voltage-gated calcium channel subunit alpha Cav2.3) n=1 Tax=Cladocopium goreaui TaxID=2562237 RepID=A0A9P1BSE6_9DINO|nr:unnamed protein product [Cladocopium goreaui]